jgi:hypothetical protein
VVFDVLVGLRFYVFNLSLSCWQVFEVLLVDTLCVVLQLLFALEAGSSSCPCNCLIVSSFLLLDAAAAAVFSSGIENIES